MPTHTTEPPRRDIDMRGSLVRAPDTTSGWRMAAVRQLLLARWKLAGAVAASIFIVGIVVLVLIPRRYTSHGSFVVEAAPTGGLSGAMAIISQLNPNMAGGDSPKFYVDLVGSRPVREHLLMLVPRAQCGSSGRSVLQIISGRGNDPTNLAKTVERLRHRVSSGYDLRTGVISVGVEADCPELARELTDSLIASVNSFNIDRRQTRAKLRREFSEQRAREADSALQSAENALSSFQAANRVITNPRLELDADRLRRRISEREEMASTLRREASSARLEEINSIPALTVVEPPDTPIRPSYPKRRVAAAMLLVIALGFGIAVVLLLFIVSAVPPVAAPAVQRLHRELRMLLAHGSPAAEHDAA